MYHVYPERHTRSRAVKKDEEQEKVRDVLFSTTEPDTLSSARHQRAHRHRKEPHVDRSRAGRVPAKVKPTSDVPALSPLVRLPTETAIVSTNYDAETIADLTNDAP